MGKPNDEHAEDKPIVPLEDMDLPEDVLEHALALEDGAMHRHGRGWGW